jgi:hypothetical protein
MLLLDLSYSFKEQCVENDACHNRKVVDDLVKAMPAKEQRNRTKSALISNAVSFLNETAKTNEELENLVSEVCHWSKERHFYLFLGVS